MPNHEVAALSGTGDSLIGRTIAGRFQITGLIARGGMGKVYRALQAPLGRACAVKVLDARLAERDAEFHRRFFLEASTASKLTHPHTVTIFDYGRTSDGVFFMAMELLHGTTLRQTLQRTGPFSEARAAYIARQICRALAEAHGLGVIHRDLKSANIFLVAQGEDDFVKVLDFGLVKDIAADDFTEAGAFMGSPKYMAPEQIRGERVDARADIYALGVILYEMIAGRVPFDRPTDVNILMAHVNDEVPALRLVNPAAEVSPAMEDTIRRCLAKDPAARFATMDDVNESLKRLSQRPSVGPLPSDSIPSLVESPHDTKLTAPSRRHPRLNVVALGVGVVGALAFATFGVRSHRAQSAATAPPSIAASATTNVALAAPRPPAPSAAANSAIARVRVVTDPAGATVREDGVEVCSATPCDLVFQGARADAEREHVLMVSRPGFVPVTRPMKVGEGTVSVKLARAHAPLPGQAAPRPDPFRDINFAR